MSENVKTVAIRIRRDWYVSCDTDVTGSMCPRCALDNEIDSPWAACRLCTVFFGDGSGRFRRMTREDIPLRTAEGLADPWAKFAIRGVVMRMDGRWMSITSGGKRGTKHRACAMCSAVKCLDTDPLYRFCESLRPNGRSFREVKREGVLNELLEMEA